MQGIHRLGQRAPTKSKPHRNPIGEPDLLRVIDTMIFAEQLQKLTPQELKEARETKMYQMLARLGNQAYRAGEAGLRPRPSLIVMSNDAQEADEQVTPTEARPQVNGGVSEAEADSAGGGANVSQFPATQPPQPADTAHSPGVL